MSAYNLSLATGRALCYRRNWKAAEVDSKLNLHGQPSKQKWAEISSAEGCPPYPARGANPLRSRFAL